MGESTTPGCLLASSGALTDSATGCGAGALGTYGAGAAAATVPRATRTRWPSCSISISVSPVSSRSLVSSRIKAWSTSGVFGDFAIEDSGLVLFFDADQSGQSCDRQRVAVDPEAADHRFGGLRHIGIMPETFTRVNVGDVDFDRRHLCLYRQQRIENGDRRRGIAGGIEHDAGRLFGMRFLDPVDQLAFLVRLPEYHLEAEALGGGAAQLFNVGERGAAVFFRLARAEHVQIGSVEDVDGFSHSGAAGDGVREVLTAL